MLSRRLLRTPTAHHGGCDYVSRVGPFLCKPCLSDCSTSVNDSRPRWQSGHLLWSVAILAQGIATRVKSRSRVVLQRSCLQGTLSVIIAWVREAFGHSPTPARGANRSPRLRLRSHSVLGSGLQSKLVCGLPGAGARPVVGIYPPRVTGVFVTSGRRELPGPNGPSFFEGGLTLGVDNRRFTGYQPYCSASR